MGTILFLIQPLSCVLSAFLIQVNPYRQKLKTTQPFSCPTRPRSFYTVPASPYRCSLCSCGPSPLTVLTSAFLAGQPRHLFVRSLSITRVTYLFRWHHSRSWHSNIRLLPLYWGSVTSSYGKCCNSDGDPLASSSIHTNLACVSESLFCRTDSWNFN